MKQLHHNGVLVPPRDQGKGLTIKVKGINIKLTPDQEEMAIAWVKKIGTPYVEDPIFAKNFRLDFSHKLGIDFKMGEIDYSQIIVSVERERERKANLTKEEKKQLAEQRKKLRAQNKERYGYAWVDGERMEVANYAVEPSSIFMGRGRHPLRGRWKRGPNTEDIELNLSPDANIPSGRWKAIIWEPRSMWIARWRDDLTNKMKYVWFSDSSILKQQKEIIKFDKAWELRQNLERIQEHIWENLDTDNLKRKKTATICFLIDKLKIRVGDEKDPDEADTVGASTLRPEHIHFRDGNTVALDFLGKDSVPHIFKVQLPDRVIRNLKEFTANATSTLFGGIGSKHVSELLDEVMPGLSARVFRTYYASEATESKLKEAPVKNKDPQYLKKYYATSANIEAAKVCNHRRTIPKTWEQSLKRKKDRLKILKERMTMNQFKLEQKAKELKKKYLSRLKKQKTRLKELEQKLEANRHKLSLGQQQRKSVETLRNRINRQEKAIARQKQRLKEIKSKNLEGMKKLKRLRKSRQQHDKTSIDQLILRIKTQNETRDYNLTTSLKSYIDPRIYYKWGKRIDYDWKLYYPKTLQRKFSWVDSTPSST